MKYELEFEINDLPKTINAIGYMHWTVRAKEIKKWHGLVRCASNGKLPDAPLEKAKLILTRFSSKCPDSDGLVHSFKSVIDGLRKSNILSDDNFGVIGMPEYKWEKAPPKKGKIKVKVEEI